MNSRSLLDRLTCTRVASWSDCRFHRRRLAGHGFVAKKVYILGYAATSPDTMQKIAQCVYQQSAGCLRGVFLDLPQSDDFLPEPVGAISPVYLLLDTAQAPRIVVLEAAPGSTVLLQVPAKGFPHHFLFGKTFVGEGI